MSISVKPIQSRQIPSLEGSCIQSTVGQANPDDKLPGLSSGLVEKIEQAREQRFNRITTYQELKNLSSPLVKRIDFSKNSHVQPEWILGLPRLFPNLEELDLRRCMALNDSMTGIAINQFKSLKVIQLNGSNMSADATSSFWIREEGESRIRIEHDWNMGDSVLGAVIHRGLFYPARGISFWDILDKFTQEGNWCEEEMVMLFQQHKGEQNPQIISWKLSVLEQVKQINPPLFERLQAECS